MPTEPLSYKHCAGLIFDLAIMILVAAAPLYLPGAGVSVGIWKWGLLGGVGAAMVIDSIVLCILISKGRGSKSKTLSPETPTTSGATSPVVTPIPPQQLPITLPMPTGGQSASNQLNIAQPQNLPQPPPTPQNPFGTEGAFFLKTLTGKTTTIKWRAEQTVEEVLLPICQEYEVALNQISIIFAGKTLNIEERLHTKVSHWCREVGMLSASTLHLLFTIEAKRAAPQPARVSQTNLSVIFRNLLYGEYHTLNCAENDTLESLCQQLAVQFRHPPETTLIRIICAGRLLTQPQLMSENIFKLKEEYQFIHAETLHVLIYALSDADIEWFVEKLQESKFPGLMTGVPSKVVIAHIKTLIWSTCDRIFRGKLNCVSSDLAKQGKIFEQMMQHKDISDSLKSYISILLSLITEAGQRYRASSMSTYDAIVQMIKEELASLPPSLLPSGKESIRLTINNELGTLVGEIEKSRLVQESPYFGALLSGHYLESPDAPEIELEEETTSPYLINYLSDPSFSMAPLSLEELGRLLNTAQAYTFARLSLLCQATIVERFKQQSHTGMSQEDVHTLLESTPYLARVNAIRQSLHI